MSVVRIFLLDKLLLIIYYILKIIVDKIDAYENISKPTFNKKMWKPSISGQYQLDAGQKKIGLQYCSECDFVYQVIYTSYI